MRNMLAAATLLLDPSVASFISSSSSPPLSSMIRMHRQASHNAINCQCLQRHQRSYGAILLCGLFRATPVSHENDEVHNVPSANNKTTISSTSSSSLPFPRSSYHLSRNEEQIQNQFISFIDHFDDSYTQVSRLIEPRRYARSNQFDSGGGGGPHQQQDMKKLLPTIDDVACPPSLFGPIASLLAWNRLPARIVVGTMAYLSFPIIIDILESYTILDYEMQNSGSGGSDLSFYDRLHILTSWMANDAAESTATTTTPSEVSVSINDANRDRLTNLVNLYIPGVSIVLGTYFSMTLDILYTRYSRLQEAVSLEASMLSYCFQLLLELFDEEKKDDDNNNNDDSNKNLLISSVQSIADQIHVLIRDSRGKETMRIIYNDPYAHILRIVQRYSRQRQAQEGGGNTRQSSSMLPAQDASLVAVTRDVIRQLFELRTKRLNHEANGLAPAHFDLMTFLAGLLLVGTTLGTVATAQTNGIPTEVSRWLFSTLVVCYTTIYEMAYDLNRPFDGIYQIRRSGAAMHFLQIKHMVASHPVLRNQITFDPIVDEAADETEIPVISEIEQRDIWYN